MRSFALQQDSITSLADQMQPHIGDEDPVVRANLRGIEPQARIVHDNLKTVMTAWGKTLDTSFHGSGSNAYRRFDAKRDRKRFLKQTRLIDTCARTLHTLGANPELSQAALTPVNDPTDLTPVPRQIAKAADTVRTAHADFHEALAPLKKLEQSSRVDRAVLRRTLPPACPVGPT